MVTQHPIPHRIRIFTLVWHTPPIYLLPTPIHFDLSPFYCEICGTEYTLCKVSHAVLGMSVSQLMLALCIPLIL
jgi:hypothetical protein